jgi:hypothetical protein
MSGLPLLTEETPGQKQPTHTDASLEKAGFKRGKAKGAVGMVGTHPAGNIRFKHTTKKRKTTSSD